MSRLVVVSNRIADPRKPAAGGLAVAVRESLQQTGGSGLAGAAGFRTKRSPTLQGKASFTSSLPAK
ncbi:hypothetical protein PPGU19_096260 (plasmid) [Paraburkholderia sp. PGU19]|nr:hypothetical protein PPGU19_096260 [Paraburkholderia sp. PGU19]